MNNSKQSGFEDIPVKYLHFLDKRIRHAIKEINTEDALVRSSSRLQVYNAIAFCLAILGFTFALVYVIGRFCT